VEHRILLGEPDIIVLNLKSIINTKAYDVNCRS